MFLRDLNIIRKYIRMANVSGLSTEDNLLHLFQGSGLKCIFHGKVNLLICFKSLFKIIRRSFCCFSGRIKRRVIRE